jgi:hypothetical protein
MTRSFSAGLFLAGFILSSACDPKETDLPDDTGTPSFDGDGDGYTTDEDCDDADPAVYPGAEEVCDEVDNDCDGEIDEEVAEAWYPDSDGDGWGDEAGVIYSCEQPTGAVAQPGDCDDDDAAVNPDAAEACNGVDDDCDGEIDNDPTDLWYADADADGFGNAAFPIESCDPGDGWAANDTDCDDTDTTINPDADEVCDSVDNDCDGLIDDDDDGVMDQSTWYLDGDADGYGLDDSTALSCEQPSGYAALSGDCDDSDVAYNPGATEDDCADPNDYNCDGSVGYADDDGDGFAACEECDDTDAAQFPGADELCNGEDDDCDGTVDEDDAIDALTWYADADMDGYGDAASTTMACSAPSGFVADDTDCDDSDAAVNPAATELCDGIDNDCDGLRDDADDSVADQSVWYADADADGYGDAAVTMDACLMPSGYLADDTDCDDSDAAQHPGADELCNGEDDDCDGDVDEDDAIDASTWYADDDDDGYGDPAVTAAACAEPSGYVADATDCDDNDDDVNPGATELCNGVDDDCDGTLDEADAADASTWYADADADGYGDVDTSTAACSAPSGYVADATDCDDTVTAVNPAATETCDGIDNDCDGLVDDDDSVVSGTSTWYLDYDGDSYGDAGRSTDACDAPSGYVADATDCDDTDTSAYPGAIEICDGADNDCDGSTDEDDASDASTWYADVDLDGYGDPASSTTACAAPSGYVADATDCDDTLTAVNPGAAETCNGTDDDCDGDTDEDDASDASTWYADVDSDGYGDPASSDIDCDQPTGYVTDDSDCDDTDPAVSPAAAEICDSIDNDCDGDIDDGDSGVTGQSTWYMDYDGDSYGDASRSTAACDQPSGYVADDSDCDDTDAAIKPGATEVCDGADNDCDGDVDDDDASVTGQSTWYLDADGDGYGDATDLVVSCFAPSGYVADGTDCDDDDASMWEDCNPFRSFDGTTASTWETLRYAPSSVRGFQSYHMEADYEVIYHQYGSTQQYYDPSTDSWTSLGSTPYTSYWAGQAPWDGLLWSIRNGNVYSYDPATDTWTTVTSTSWSDDQNMTESDEDGVLYGYDSSGNIAVYDTVTGTQTSHPTGLGSEYETRMGYDPISRAVFFGYFGASYLHKFDIETGVVSSVTSIPESQLNDIFCSDRSGHIYAAGGTSGTTMWQYDVATDTWSAIPDLPSDHGNNNSCVVSDSGWLYVGGSSGFYRLELY